MCLQSIAKRLKALEAEQPQKITAHMADGRIVRTDFLTLLDGIFTGLPIVSVDPEGLSEHDYDLLLTQIEIQREVREYAAENKLS